MAKTPSVSRSSSTDAPVSGWSLNNTYLPYLVLGLAAIAAYGLSLSNNFVFFDDDKAILYNPVLKEPSLRAFFSGQNLGMFAPLTWIAYWLGSQVGGLSDPYGYHLLSLVFHTLSGMLVFAFLQSLLSRTWISFFTALLFVVHPIQVEAVSWAAAQSTVLYGMFYLAGLFTYVQFAQSGRKSWLGWTLFFFLLSLLSKSAAVTFPLMLVALDIFFFRVKKGITWLQKAPFFIGSILFGWYTFQTRAAEGHDIALQSQVFSALDRLWMVSETLLFYPFKILAPFGFSIDYPFVKTAGSWPWYTYAAPLVVAGIAFFAWKKTTQLPEVRWGLALYLLPLLVMLPFQTVGTFEMRFDRYAYLSSIGIFLLIGLLLENTVPVVRRSSAFLLATSLLLLTIEQTNVWKNGTTLFKNCVKHTPESSICLCNLGYNELISNDFNGSVEHYSKAISLDPTTLEAYNGRGQAYLQLKNYQAALPDFSKAIDMGLSSPKLFFNRGKALVMTGKAVEAIPDFSKSLQLEPNNPEAYYLRGFANEKAEQLEAAIADYSACIRQNPNSLEALVNRGLLYYRQLQYDAAIQDYTAALAINPNLAMALNNRANAYLSLGDKQKALADVEKALQVNPEYQRAQETKNRILGN